MRKFVNVKFPYDLRTSLSDKRFEASLTTTSWMAFVNNAANLVHLVHPDEEWIVRIRFNPSLKGCNPTYMRQRIIQRIEHRIIL